MTRPPVDPAVLRACTRVSAWKSIALMVAIYAAVVGLAWAGGRGSGWRLAVPAIIVIAGLQNHLLILLHEAAHLLVHPNRRVNDTLGDIFCAVPFLNLLRNYRAFHLTHHKYAGSPANDPEVAVYAREDYIYKRRRGWPLAWMLFKDVCGYHYLIFVSDMARFATAQWKAGRLEPPGPRDLLLYAIVWGGVGVSATIFGFWTEVLVFWLLPQPTILMLLLKLHGYGEHTGATGPTEMERTWVHVFHPVVDFFIYPINSGFHLEHHLFPKVPWYHMRAFRRALLENAEYAARAEKVTVRGYFFGERTILNTMLLGEGEYRLDQLAAETKEVEGDVVASETKAEVEEQFPALAGAGEGALSPSRAASPPP